VIALRIIILVVVLAAFTCSAHAMRTYDEVKASYKKSDAVLLDRHGAVINDLRVDSKSRRLDWTPLKDISPAFLWEPPRSIMS
jgi:penicillin-binding protein 1C